MKSEIWTATHEEETDNPDNPYIVFTVKDETSGEEREEKRYRMAIPLMLTLGGYPSVMGAIMLMTPLPWRFRKVGEHIYIDGPSVGVDDYHPIDAVPDAAE